jgi:hypothetical protein
VSHNQYPRDHDPRSHPDAEALSGLARKRLNGETMSNPFQPHAHSEDFHRHGRPTGEAVPQSGNEGMKSEVMGRIDRPTAESEQPAAASPQTPPNCSHGVRRDQCFKCCSLRAPQTVSEPTLDAGGMTCGASITGKDRHNGREARFNCELRAHDVLTPHQNFNFGTWQWYEGARAWDGHRISNALASIDRYPRSGASLTAKATVVKEILDLRRQLAAYREVVERAKGIFPHSYLDKDTGQYLIGESQVKKLAAALAALTPPTGEDTTNGR